MDREKGLGWDGNAKAIGTKDNGMPVAPGPCPLGTSEKEAEERQGDEDSSKIREEA